MQKKGETADRRLSELVEHHEKTQTAIKKGLVKFRRQKKIDEAGGIISHTEMEMQETIKLQEKMKKANRIIRSKKQSKEAKLNALLKLGIKETTARKLFEPDFA